MNAGAVMVMALACAALFTLASCSPGKDPSTGGDGLKSWGYIMTGTIDPLKDKIYLADAVSRYDALCLTGYYLNGRGDLVTSEPSATLCTRLRGARSLYPLVTFSSVAEGKSFLGSFAAWESAVQRIVSLVESAPFSGVHFDFEYLPAEFAPRLGEFLALAGERIRAVGPKTLSMAIFPPEEFPVKWSSFHDLSKIGRHLDEIVLMCYDMNRPDTAPGPVTSARWTERNIARVIKSFPASRTWLGIPAYGYLWPPSGRATVISARDGVRESTLRSGARDQSGNLTYSFATPSGRYIAYVSDAQMRRTLTVLARDKGLKGIALWRLGMEDE